jgi:hypothetical protein
MANSDAKANASRALDEALVDRSYVPARAEKNRQFDTAPGRNEHLPADEVFAAIDRVRAGANCLAPGTLPNEFMQRLDRLRPRIDPDSGENVGGPARHPAPIWPISGDTSTLLRRELSKAETLTSPTILAA